MMRLNVYILVGQKGWISLPIIGLLLAVSSVSVHYQESIMASYQWRGVLSEVDEGQGAWAEFEQQFVSSASFTDSVMSRCQGFCELHQGQYTPDESIWQAASSSPSFYYQWHRFEKADAIEFHRLCASQNQLQYQCWWWRERRLLSHGWVTVVD